MYGVFFHFSNESSRKKTWRSRWGKRKDFTPKKTMKAGSVRKKVVSG